MNETDIFLILAAKVKYCSNNNDKKFSNEK